MAASIAQCSARIGVIFAGRGSYCSLLSSRTYAVKTLVGKMAPSAQKSRMEVEEDPEKLMKYCCGANIYQEGTDPELRPDSEYPDWLWSLRLQREPPNLSEIDPDTKYYWKRLHRMNAVRNKKIAKHLEKMRKINYPNDIV